MFDRSKYGKTKPHIHLETNNAVITAMGWSGPKWSWFGFPGVSNHRFNEFCKRLNDANDNRSGYAGISK